MSKTRTVKFKISATDNQSSVNKDVELNVKVHTTDGGDLKKSQPLAELQNDLVFLLMNRGFYINKINFKELTHNG